MFTRSPICPLQRQLNKSSLTCFPSCLVSSCWSQWSDQTVDCFWGSVKELDAWWVYSITSSVSLSFICCVGFSEVIWLTDLSFESWNYQFIYFGLKGNSSLTIQRINQCFKVIFKQKAASILVPGLNICWFSLSTLISNWKSLGLGL